MTCEYCGCGAPLVTPAEQRRGECEACTWQDNPQPLDMPSYGS